MVYIMHLLYVMSLWLYSLYITYCLTILCYYVFGVWVILHVLFIFWYLNTKAFLTCSLWWAIEKKSCRPYHFLQHIMVYYTRDFHNDTLYYSYDQEKSYHSINMYCVHLLSSPNDVLPHYTKELMDVSCVQQSSLKEHAWIQWWWFYPIPMRCKIWVH